MCDHKYQLIRETGEAIIEVCSRCKKKLITKKCRKTGRIDNKKYLKEHAVEFAQPRGRTSKLYEKHYGKYTDKNAEMKKALEKQKEEAEARYEKEMQEIKRREMSTGKIWF